MICKTHRTEECRLKKIYMRQTKREELSAGASMACGAVAGLLAATATFPLEVQSATDLPC